MSQLHPVQQLQQELNTFQLRNVELVETPVVEVKMAKTTKRATKK